MKLFVWEGRGGDGGVQGREKMKGGGVKIEGQRKMASRGAAVNDEINNEVKF